jgi:hypothetical protein
MLDTATRTFQAGALERESRVRKAQRAERILGLVLWIGFAMTVLLFARI